MANIMIVDPVPVSAVTVRGTGADNLLTADPREVWIDTGDAGFIVMDIDLGSIRPVDTVALCSIFNAAPGLSWFIQGGTGTWDEVLLMDWAPLRVPERPGSLRTMTHALWSGSDQVVRYVRIGIDLGGVPDAALTIGRLIVGDKFQPEYNNEWGAGRGVRDTSTVTRLPTGGVAVVEGAKYGTFSWTLGDLSEEETDRLYEMQLSSGESRPVLVVEDPDRTAGLRNRIHYGGLTGLRAYDRRNKRQTSWQMSVEDWTIEPPPAAALLDLAVITLGGEMLTMGGDYLTLGE